MLLKKKKKEKILEQVVNAAVVSAEARGAVGWPEGLSLQGWWHSPAHHSWKGWRNMPEVQPAVLR